MPYVNANDMVFDTAEIQEQFPSYDDKSPHDDLIGRASEQYGVDPFWTRAIVKAESNFDSKAESHVGAQGLMQLMPATAKELGVTNSLDPVQNVMGGTQYFAQMLDMFDGDKIKASAAYNAGARNIKKAIKRFGPDWLENLGEITGKHAEETQEYIKKLEKFYGEYSPQQAEQIKRGLITKENLILAEGSPIAGTYVDENKMWFDQEVTADPSEKDKSLDDVLTDVDSGLARALIGGAAMMPVAGVAGLGVMAYGGMEDIPGMPGGAPDEKADSLKAASNMIEMVAGIPMKGLSPAKQEAVQKLMAPMVWIDDKCQVAGDYYLEKGWVSPAGAAAIKTVGQYAAYFGLPYLGKTFIGKLARISGEFEKGLSVLDGKALIDEAVNSSLANPDLVAKLAELDKAAGINKIKKQTKEVVEGQKKKSLELTPKQKETLKTTNEFRTKSGLEPIDESQIIAHKERQAVRRQEIGKEKTSKFREAKGLEKSKTAEEVRGAAAAQSVNSTSKGLIKYDGEWEGVGAQFTTTKDYAGMKKGQTIVIKGEPTPSKLNGAILKRAQEYAKFETDLVAKVKADAPPKTPLARIKEIVADLVPKKLRDETGTIGYDIESISKKALAKLREPQYKGVVTIGELPPPKGAMVKNPSARDVRGMIKESAYKEVRGVINPETGEMFIADAAGVMHKGLAREAGIPWEKIQGDPDYAFTLKNMNQLEHKIAGMKARGLEVPEGLIKAAAKPVKGGAPELSVKGKPVTKESLPDMLKNEDYAILTAENPANKKLSPTENAQRNLALEEYMDAEGIEYHKVKGQYDNKAENSFIVTGITQEQALKLGKRFEQESVITKEGMAFQDGKLLPAKHENLKIDPTIKDNFTVANIGGKEVKFAMDFDWDNPVTVAKKKFSIFDKLREEKGAVGSDITDINKFMKQEAAEQAKLLKERKFAGSINLERQSISEAAKTVERQVFADRGKKPSANNKEQIAKAEKILNKWSKDPKEWIKATDRIKKGKTPTIEEEIAHRMLNADNFELFIEMGKAVEKGDITQLEFDNFHSAMKLQAVDVVDPLASEAGRRLQSYNVEVGKHRANKAILELKENMNDRQFDAFTKVNWDDPAAVKAFIRELPDPKMMDYVYEFWYNSILSGIPTHLVNTISTGLWTMFQVPHKATVASIQKLSSPFTTKQRTAFLNEIGPMLSGYKEGAKRGIGAAKETLIKGRITEFETKWAQEVGSAMNAWQRSPHKALRAAAPYMSIPTKALRAMDVFFNAVAFDGEVASMARRVSNKRGLKGEARSVFENEYRMNPPKEALESAMKQAKYSTFMDDPGFFSQGVIKMRGQIPGGRFVVPFVNTIGNLLKRGVEMTPGIGLVEPLTRKLAGKPGQVASQVMAKQLEGAILTYMLMEKIEAGEITGDVPTDPAAKRAFYRQGKLPWSAKIGDKYRAYRRAEPFNTIIATAAIAHDKITNAKDDATKTDIFLGIVDDMKDNFIDSAYMSGVSRLFFNRYKNDNGNHIKNFANNIIASFVPYSSFLRSMARSYEALDKGDVTLRERERPEGKWYDPFLMQLPEMPKKFPARLNVWGEDIKIEGNMFRQWLPYKYTTASKDPVEIGLEKLNVHPDVPAKKIKHKGEMVTLDDDIYRKYAMGAGARTYEYYSKLMSRPRYMAQIDKAVTNEKQFEKMSKNLHDVWTSNKKKYRKKALKEQLKRNKQRRN